jgi:branched-chain amino acid transport system permease protein
MKQIGSIGQNLKKNVIVIVFITVFMLVPMLVKMDYLIRVMIEVFFFGALGTAWNILGGFGRQTSWASASFFSVGAYTSMLMFLKLGGISPWISIFIGMFLSAILAVIIGLPCFRLRGVFFAIATIASASIVRQLLLYFKTFTGGAMGIAFKIRIGNSLAKLAFESERAYYYVALIWMLITVLVSILINRSKLGYYLKAIREDEDAAESLGVRSGRMKLIAFIISAMLLSATGTLYAFKVGYIDPFMVASHDMSIRIGITAILGGMGTIWGPVIGAFLSVPMLELSNKYLSNLGNGGAGFAMYGLIIVLVVLFRPNGIISFYTDYQSRRALRLKSKGEKKV